MSNLLKFGLNIIADVFYPKYCFGCRRAAGYLCKFCVNQVSVMKKPFCVVCNKHAVKGFTHEPCKNPLVPERLLSALPYQDAIVSDMLITGKYYFIPELFAILGALTAHTILERDIDFPQEDFAEFIVCSIPLHSQRQRWRGFNQSEIAGKIIAQAFNLPYVNLLTRTKKTKTQKDLDHTARKTNMQNAFACNYQPPKKVIVIDDVTTTGQTFLEAAKVLKQNGAQTVWCISIAKD
jgi:competence protein ComFC